MKNITFINAGAGSGKTFRLTEELFRSIKNKDCKANEVMLTTFTKTAAEEIKIKAREKLLEEEGFILEANNLQNAFIGTVHAVGAQVIKKFWHYIGFPKDIKVMDENDTDFYFNQAIAKIPTNDELETLNKINFKFDPKDASNFYNPNNWKEELLKIIGLARTNHINDFTLSKEKSLEKAKLILNTDGNLIDLTIIQKAIVDIIKIGNELPDTRNGGRKNAILKLNSVNLKNIKYNQLLKIKSIIDDLINKKLDDGKLEKACNTLEKIPRSKILINDIEIYNNLLFEIALKSLEAYNNYKKEIGLIDYSDMEEAFLQLLEISEVQDEIRNTIKLVLVDEFQDSSPIQLAIFIKLSNIVNKSIWVGDPKQSIYSFRATDPQLIEAIIKEFDNNVDKSLKTDNLPDSWRSRPEIVQLVNNIFIPALRNQVTEKNIKLNAVRTDKGFSKSALHHFNLVNTNANANSYYKSLAQSIVKLLEENWEITNKHKSNPDKDASKEKVAIQSIKPCDIAILCKTQKTIEIISKELKTLGCQVSAEIPGLEETAEYRLVLAMIKLMQSGNNTLAISELKILTEHNFTTSNLIDERLEFLNELSEENKTGSKEHNNEYFEKLNSWGKDNFLVKGIKNLAQQTLALPVPQLIELLINQFNLFAIVSKWGNEEQRIENLQKIISYAYKYDERCVNMGLGSSISGFIHYIENIDVKREGATKNENAINISTYHASKGLEWPCVILTDFQKDVKWSFISREIFGVKIQNDPKIDLNNILSNRSISILPWPFGVGTTKVSDDFQNHIRDNNIFDRANERIEDELKRLMYVGMTRARDYLITTGISGQNRYDWINIVNKHDNWDFKDYADIDSGKSDVFDRGVKMNVQKINFDENYIGNVNPLKVRYFKEKKNFDNLITVPFVVNPSTVKYTGVTEISLKDEIHNRISIGKSLEDKEDILGNCLHDILYLYLGDSLNNTKQGDENKIETLLINHNIENSLNKKEISIAIDKLFNYINLEFEPLQWYRELAIETIIDDQLFKGEIDLLLETSKEFILIDYKSYPGAFENVLDKGHPKYAGQYAGQLNTYAAMLKNVQELKAIRTFIYYTVLGKIVELK